MGCALSTFERGYGLLKSLMLMSERFDRIDARIAALSDDVADLAHSHVHVSERVADIEGYLRAATGTPFGDRPRLERK